MTAVDLLSRLVPTPLRGHLTPARLLLQNLRRWPAILLSQRAGRQAIRVSYGQDVLPTLDEPSQGGIVKVQRMQEAFPNSPRHFNILYLVSSGMPEDWAQTLWLARRKGARLVWNQNGVGYPGWRGSGWREHNAPMIRALQAADCILYQSRFCKLSADRFLGEPRARWEILYNPVDTRIFTPATADPDPDHVVLLLGGSQYQYYRLDVALRTSAGLVEQGVNARLLVTGRLCWAADERECRATADRRVTELRLDGRVTFLGPYSQRQASEILRRAHILLHTKYNDPCPGLVLEAMACGLPIVYSATGGVPELVDEAAGIGVPGPVQWEEDVPPAPDALTQATLRVLERRAEFAAAARRRAVERFDLQPWLDRHRAVFTQLLG